MAPHASAEACWPSSLVAPAQCYAVPATHHASDATTAMLWGIARTLSAMAVQIYKKKDLVPQPLSEQPTNPSSPGTAK